MSLNALSDECIIIGGFSLILSLGAFITDAMNLAHKFQQSEVGRFQVNKGFMFKIALYLTSAFLSILLIIGILERRRLLMVPWLLQCFVFVALSFMYVYWFFSPAFTRLDVSSMLMTVLIVGGETIVLYPICALFHEYRLEGK